MKVALDAGDQDAMGRDAAGLAVVVAVAEASSRSRRRAVAFSFRIFDGEAAQPFRWPGGMTAHGWVAANGVARAAAG